jgi:hypothetical protein
MNTFVWNDIADAEKMKELKENHEYLACLDAGHDDVSEWRLAVVNWYTEGSVVTIYESDNTPHKFKIKKSGFYHVNNCNPKSGHIFYLLHGVKYWTDITLPEISPENTLTIE